MNKDVIYIEPEDDITDIIAKIEKTKEKIVALVPPKKAGVFRSVVNIKLIAKAGATAEKSVVLVTVDPSIVKLAAATKLPVAKNLQSAPEIPVIETAEPVNEQTIEDVSDPAEEVAENEPKADEDAAKSSQVKSAKKSEESANEDEDKAEDDEEEEAPTKSAKKNKKPMKLSGNKLKDWFRLHKKLAIFLAIFLVGVIGFLIWAFGFAPAVDISIAIKTESKNFSEGITFADQLTSENAKEGKFYLEQKKLEETQEIEFEATGEKNQGDKANGELIIYTYFKSSGSVQVGAGTIFAYNGLNFATNGGVTLSWDGETVTDCKNNGQASAITSGCLISSAVSVTATEPGTKYNIAAASSGWNTIAPVAAYSEKAMSGGTDKIITVVQQSDIINAQGQLTTAKEEENKAKLYKTIDDSYYILEGTFEQSTSSVTATPAADQEVASGTKPKLTATTTISVYVVNKDKLTEFVKAKANLDEGQKVYEVKDIYIENFTNKGASSTAKLKAQYYVGPKITETEVVDKVRGKGLGDAQREIRDINGVSDVKINTSYPWVMTVPGDSNKISVSFEVKDQDGKEIQNQNTGDESDDNNDNNDQKNKQ